MTIFPGCECCREFTGPPCLRALGKKPPSAVRFHVTAEEESGPPWVDTAYPDSGYMPLKDNGHVKVNEILFNAIDVDFDLPLNNVLSDDTGSFLWDITNPISEDEDGNGARVLQGWSAGNGSSICSVGVLATQRRDCFFPEFAYYGSEFRKLEFYLEFEYRSWVPYAELQVKWTTEWHGMGYQVPTSSGFVPNWPVLTEQKIEKGDVSTDGVIGKTFRSQEGNDSLVLDDTVGYSISRGGEYKQAESQGGGFCLIPTWDGVTPAPDVGGTYAYMVGQTSGCMSPYYGEQRRVGSPSIMATATFLE